MGSCKPFTSACTAWVSSPSLNNINFSFNLKINKSVNPDTNYIMLLNTLHELVLYFAGCVCSENLGQATWKGKRDIWLIILLDHN